MRNAAINEHDKPFRHENPQPAPRANEIDLSKLRFIRAIAWLITAAVGLLQAWVSRFQITPDGVNYLDMASALIKRDWQHIVNGYWSPFYSWVLALPLALLGRHAFWETSLLHLLNFVGLLIALRCFELFLRVFLQTRARSDEVRYDAWLSSSSWSMLGYALFISTSLYLVPVSFTTPDIWVCSFTYLAAALFVQIARNERRWKSSIVLGIVLGFAYLTKAFYFPMSAVFLCSLFFCLPRPVRLKHTTLAAFGFLLIAGPWITALSSSKHRLTFGDAGHLAYAMTIDQVGEPGQWRGQDDTGTPTHAVRELYISPQILDFATPAAGTYSLWFDLSYWMEGVHPRFDWRGQFRALRQSAGTYFQIAMSQIEYVVGVLTLLFLGPSFSILRRCIGREWYLWIPAIVACSAYSIILVEPRYVAPFVLLIWISAFSCLMQSVPTPSGRLIHALILAMVCTTGLRVTKGMLTDLTRLSASTRNIDWEVAQGLREADVRPGDRVAHISAVGEVQWARLAGVRIVSGIPFGEQDHFWNADLSTKETLFGIMASTGAKIVVTKDPPSNAEAQGWRRLGGTTFYAHRLP